MSLGLYGLGWKHTCTTTITQPGYFLRGNYAPVKLASCFHSHMAIWPSSLSGLLHHLTFQLTLAVVILDGRAKI